MASKVQDWLTEEGLTRLQGWARDGLINKQIAKNAGVGDSTLREWRTKYPEINEAIKKGKEVVDREVENALYKSALGYTMTIREPIKIRTVEYDKNTGRKIAEKEEWRAIEKQIHVPPNVTAQIFWLKNRKPEKWREKHEITDTTALEKLDAILAENVKNANAKAE